MCYAVCPMCRGGSALNSLRSFLVRPLYLSIPSLSSNSFRMNTCKNQTKQIALTPFRMNTYKKHRGWGWLLLTSKSRLVASSACLALLLLSFALLAPLASAQGKRKVIIDQDAAGPGGTDQQAILALVNSPDTDVLGITVLTGDAWRDEEVLHTLRTLEIVGRTDIPVVPGAAFPLVNSKEFIAKWETSYGKIVYQGAWNFANGHAVHGPNEIPPMPEGAPTTKASTEDAAHFLVRTVRQYPHEVTIYAAGPMTDLALAIALDPQFPELSKELILMGGSINPQTDDPEFTLTPKREFNLWMDPEASHAVFHAHWPRIVVTTVDISVKTRVDKSLIDEINKS